MNDSADRSLWHPSHGRRPPGSAAPPDPNAAAASGDEVGRRTVTVDQLAAQIEFLEARHGSALRRCDERLDELEQRLLDLVRLVNRITLAVGS